MALFSIGKKTVTTAGTPVQVIATSTNCTAAYFQALSTNTGKIYIGAGAGLIKASFANVLRVIVPPPASPLTLDSWNPQGITMGPIDLSTIWVDSDNSGEGILVSFLTN
jgi:hypothetical protein